MAEKQTIIAKARGTDPQTQRELRDNGQVLGVVYGFQTEATPVAVQYSEMLRTYRKAGTSALITLDLDGKKHEVLVKSLEVHPVRDTIEHVDFFVVNPKKKTPVKIPVQFEGVSPAVKNLGGIFTASHDYITIRCLPNDIPTHFTVDISSLNLVGSALKLSDMNLDTKYEVVKMEPGTIICSIAGRKSANAGADTENEEAPAAEVESQES